MFDETLRRLDRLGQGIKIDVPIEVDDDGYFDRQCPGTACGRAFKVDLGDWKEKVREAQVFCPFCREEDEASKWCTADQAEYLQKFAADHVSGLLGAALADDAAQFNRKQRTKPRGGFIDIGMSMSYRPGHRRIVVPASAMETMSQKFTCEECACRYASLGASFFCPACGHNSAASTFDGTIQTVRTLVTSLRETLSSSLDSDALEDAVRHVLEDQVVRLVGAYERVAEALFAGLHNESDHPRRGSLFQRVDDGSILWAAATGTGYEDFLTSEELVRLKLRFQQRHVLGHCQGIVDQAYIDRSGDGQYSAGQRLVVRQTDVLDLAELLAKLAAGLRTLAPRS